MAQKQYGTSVDFDFTNSLRAEPNGGGDTNTLEEPLDYTSISNLKIALSVYDPKTYTDDVLNQMTVNDMVFALRNVEDPKTIADYMKPQSKRP